MDHSHPNIQLTIAIVGCGLGGLAAAHCLISAGHRVTIFERAHIADEVGAGLQVAPNVSRLLWRWGLREDLDRIAVKPTAATWRRYDTGEKIGFLPTGDIEKENGVPFYNVHRGDLHRILRRKVESRAEIRTNATVVLVKPGLKDDQRLSALEYRPSVVLADGQEIHVDLVIGADGIKSVARQCLQEESQDKMKDISVAYRTILSANKLLDDPSLRELVEKSEVTCWMGPGKNVVGYWISAKTEYNLVFAVESSPKADSFFEDEWSVQASLDELDQEFVGWEPRVRRIIELTRSAVKWKLVNRPVCDSWVHPTGRVVLIGDACHPILPYGGQGAAMAIEDGAVLGNLLSRITSHSEIPSILSIFESTRKGRCVQAQENARRNEKIFHLQDGPEQKARDKELEKTLLDETRETSIWAEKMKSQKQFGYDADVEAERGWQEKATMVGIQGLPSISVELL